MSQELAEEASIDAAMSRVPNATVSMEIDTLGNPDRIRIDAASLPEWGDDAIGAIGQWRFSPSLQSGTAVAVRALSNLPGSLRNDHLPRMGPRVLQTVLNPAGNRKHPAPDEERCTPGSSGRVTFTSPASTCSERVGRIFGARSICQQIGVKKAAGRHLLRLP